MSTLLLIDAHSLIYRSFHAIPPLTTPDGNPSNALYGVSSMLIKIMKEHMPEYAAALFDRPEPSFRKKLYEPYKAHRPPAPSDLISQIISAKTLFARFGIATYEAPGFEADDLIATMAERYRDPHDLRIVILTGDMDALQLVEGDAVVVRAPGRKIGEDVIYNEQAVFSRYGVSPSQIADYKTLIGDPSDNIKGVPGIGPKTAVALLSAYKNLEGVITNKEENQKLSRIPDITTMIFSIRELILLKRDVPIGLGALSDLAWEKPVDLSVYFEEMGFSSLIKRISVSENKKEEDVHSQRLF